MNDTTQPFITQCVDDLHEKAGSKNIFHVHGSVLAQKHILKPQVRQIWNKPLEHIQNMGVVLSAFIPDVVRFGECCHNLVLSAEKLTGRSYSSCWFAKIVRIPQPHYYNMHIQTVLFYINKIAQPNVIVNGYIMEGDADDLCPKLVSRQSRTQL